MKITVLKHFPLKTYLLSDSGWSLGLEVSSESLFTGSGDGLNNGESDLGVLFSSLGDLFTP